MTVGSLLMGMSETYAVASTGRIIAGMGGVILNVLLTKMVADWFAGREIMIAMALFVNSWPVGVALGLMTLGPLAELSGWPMALHLTTMACALSLAMVAIFYRPRPGAVEPPRAASFRAIFRLGLTGRELALVLCAGMVWSQFNVGFILLITFSPDYLMAGGLSLVNAGAIVSIALWLTIVMAPVGGFMAQKSGRPNLILGLSLAAIGPAVAAVTMWDAPVLLFVIAGLLGGLPPGIIMALPARAVRGEVLAPAMGLYFTCYYVGMGVLPAVAGWIRDTAGHPSAPLLFAAAVLLSALPAFAGFCWIERRGPYAPAGSIMSSAQRSMRSRLSANVGERKSKMSSETPRLA